MVPFREENILLVIRKAKRKYEKRGICGIGIVEIRI